MTVKLDQRSAAAGDLAAAILDSAHALVVTLDTEGRITSFNRACELLSGYEADEVVGTCIWDRLLPEEATSQIRQFFASLPDGGEVPEEHENAWVTRDGRRPIIAWNNSVVRNAAGEIELIVGIGVDITERRETADDLATAQRLARIGSWRQTVATREEEWSDQFYRNLGLEPGSCPPSIEKFYEHVHPDDRQTVRETVLRSIEEKQPYSMDFRVIWPDGSVRAVHEEDDFLFGEDGEVVTLIGTMQDVTESREIADRLAMTADDLATAQRLTRIGSWRQTVATREEEWSDQFYRNLGLEPGSCPPSVEKFYEHVHPDDRQTVFEKERRSVEEKQPRGMDFRVIWPDGSMHVVREENDIVLGEDGEVVALIGTTQDITESREIADELSLTADRLARAQQTAKIGSWEWTIATNREYWSDQMYRNLGLEPGYIEVSGDKFFEHVHPDDREGVRRAIQATTETGKPYSLEFRVVWPDGTERLVHEEGEALLGGNGETVALAGTLQDVTELRASENNLQRLTTRLEYAQRTARIGNWEWDAATDRQWWSDECYRVAGYEPGEVEANDESFFAVVHRDDVAMVREKSSAAGKAGEAYEITCRVNFRDGTERVIREVGFPAYDNNGIIVGQNGTIQDITEQYRAEQTLAETTHRLKEAERIANIGNWEWDPESDRLTLSDQTYRLLGLKPGERTLTNEDYIERLHPEDREPFRKLILESLATGQSCSTQYRVQDNDGAIRTFAEHWEFFEKNGGGRRLMRGTVQDITERKKAEQELADITHSLTEAQRIAHIGNWAWDAGNGDLVWSDETCRIFGYEPGKKKAGYDRFLSRVHPDDREKVRVTVEASREQQQPYDVIFRIIRPDGEKRVVHESGEYVLDAQGRVSGMTGTVQDITEQNAAERDLAETAQRLGAAAHLARLGDWEWDPESNRLKMSDETLRICGLGPEHGEVDNEFLMAMIPAEEQARILDVMDRAVCHGETYTNEYHIVRPNGDKRSVIENGAAFHDEATGRVKLIGTIQDITERKLAEQRIALALQRLDRSQEAALIGSWEWDIDTGKVWWSDQQYRNYGAEPDGAELSINDFIQYLHPADRDTVEAGTDKALTGGAVFDQEYRVIGRDGVQRVLWCHGVAERDENGRPVNMVGTTLDITVRKDAEWRLAIMAEDLKNAQRIANIGSWEWDIRTNEEHWSDQNYRIYGLEPGSIQPNGDSFLDYAHPEDRAMLLATQDAAIAGGQPLEVDYRSIGADGVERLIHASAEVERDSAGKPVRLVGTVQDITERTRIEQALQESETRLRGIFDHASVGIGLSNLQAELIEVNQEYADFLGYSTGEMVGLTFRDFTHPDHIKISEEQFEALRAGKVTKISHEKLYIRRDGATVWGLWTLSLIHDEAGTPKYMVVIVKDIDDRKRTEAELALATERLEEAQRIANIGNWEWLPDSTDTVWSDEMYRIFGMEPDSIHPTHNNFFQMTHEDDRETIAALMNGTIETGDPYETEFRIIRTGGAMRHVFERGERYIDEQTGKASIRGILQDITERKRVEKALQESEVRLDSFFNEAPVGLAILDSEYRYVKVNGMLAQMNGASANAHIGERPSEIMIPEKAELIEGLLRRTLEHGESIDREESIVPGPDGEKRHRVYTQFPLSGDPKKPDTLGVVIVDITERVWAEQALQQTMESLAEAQQIGQMGSWTWDHEVGAEWWSDQHYRIFGLDPKSTILSGFGFLKYVHPDDRERVEKIEREAIENHTLFSVEYRVIWPDGTERVVSEHGEQFEDGPTGKPQWRGVTQDITERKRIEQELARLNTELEQRVEERTAELREAQGELIKSERLATLGQLTATVSHELRNPLGAMRTSMYVVEKKTDADDQRLKASIDRVNRNITRCDQIIDELLDYTRIRDLDLRRANIDRWLGAVLDEQNTPAEITVKRKFGAKGARVPFDDDRLRRAFINIFENACHAATDPHNANGAARRPLISVQTSLRKSRVQIEISDNGAGIPPEIREKIFEPLFSTKNFGVGLGLPTVRQIMKQHGGGIEIGETRGGGAKFALWLPLAGELEIADE